MLNWTCGTDCGPACVCGGTVYGYTVDRYVIKALCIGCRRLENYARPSSLEDDAKAADVRKAHAQGVYLASSLQRINTRCPKCYSMAHASCAEVR